MFHAFFTSYKPELRFQHTTTPTPVPSISHCNQPLYKVTTVDRWEVEGNETKRHGSSTVDGARVWGLMVRSYACVIIPKNRARSDFQNLTCISSYRTLIYCQKKRFGRFSSYTHLQSLRSLNQLLGLFRYSFYFLGVIISYRFNNLDAVIEIEKRREISTGLPSLHRIII